MTLFNPVLFCATFVFIFLRAFQQRNVGGLNYSWVVPTSFLMALVEVLNITTMVASGWSVATVVSCGLGGGLGSLVAMVIHHKYIKHGKTNEA